jgi:hypothetical protein
MNELRPLVDETPRARPLKFRPGPRRRDLTIDQILAWADAFQKRFGRWPAKRDKQLGLPDTTWSAIDTCLASGCRGLEGGSSLAQLLQERRGKRHLGRLTPLTADLILTWADAHHARTGEWPSALSGPVVGVDGETWCAANTALVTGIRGLPGGSSLAQLLAARRGVRNVRDLPPFTPEQILAWADAHRVRTGDWPIASSGPIPEAPGETWSAVEAALSAGCRGLPGGSSLARFLQTERGARNIGAVPRLEHWEILIWADAHHDRTGDWPTATSGSISEAPGETWRAVDTALLAGLRGLPGGDSLARLLSRRRGKRNIGALTPLSTEQILAWADAHHTRTGEWPTSRSGALPEGETWAAVDDALRRGMRGLPGGSSVARVLAAERGARNPKAVPPLTPEQILAWADAHHTRTGRWPSSTSGPVVGAPGETWGAVNVALETGLRGLPRGSSVARLLAEHRRKRNRLALPPVTTQQILAWADAHRARTGKWPTARRGAIPEAPGETWAGLEKALRVGRRGLRGGSSLAQLRAKHRKK